MKSSIRRGLLAVALFSAISSAISLAALARILSLTTGQRIERAHEAVTVELAALRRGRVAVAAGPAAPAWLGMRGGHAASAAEIAAARPDLEPSTRAALAEAVRRAAATREPVIVDEEAKPEALRFVGAAPAADGSFAWVAYALRPPTFVWFWRLIVVSMSVTTALLVVTALRAVVRVQRGASSLGAALAALARDLAAPVPRPEVRELAEIGDGIAALALELARAQVERDHLVEELARRDRLAALGRVVTGVAHEVRNPLASIKLRVDLGRARPDTPAPLAHDLASVSDEITRLDRLVADLLVIAGRRAGPRLRVALGQLVERRAGLLRPWAEERGVRIEARGDASAELDADAVARAVDNLVRNAVEASPPGSTVEVEVTPEGGAARVRVRDRGAGVAEERRHELFEPFFTTKPEGTGLGLALSRAIAAAHQGALAYDRRGDVTCFELSFPGAQDRAEARA